MNPINIKGQELDLSLGDGHRHPELNTTDHFLCLISNQWYFGQFGMVWYGFTFNGWLNAHGLQYDTPGTNSSRWQRIIKIDTPV